MIAAAFNIIAFLVTVCIGFYTYCKWRYGYWKRRGVPYIEPKFPYGTVDSPFTRKVALAIKTQEQYKYLKSQGHKHGGLFFTTRVTYLPIDPEYIKNIMSKDFNHFMDRGVYYNARDNPLSAHLFSIEGQKWKNLRIKLTPTFTSGKMKTMFPTLVACSEPLKTSLNNSAEKREQVEIKEVLGCFTTDVIGSCAFGIECNSFTDTNSEFRTNMKKIFGPFSKLQLLRNIIAFSNPSLGRFLRITVTPRETSQFFFNVVKQTVDYREKTNSERKDFMQLLVNLKNNKLIDDEEGLNKNEHNTKSLTLEEVAAQAFVFFLAGFETSSTTMTFCLLELASNQEIQDKLRNEINEALNENDDEFSYDLVMNMKYLEQVIDETLRKYPPVPLIPRVCVQNYNIPDTKITIEKGTRVFIPAYALHHDEEYFPNPGKFDPDRFSDANKHNIRPFTYLPFGEGPRICIGARFGLMQSKLGLAVVLKNFRFTLSEQTRLPISINPFSFILMAKDKIFLNVERIT